MRKVLSIKGGESMQYASTITFKMDKWLPNNINRKIKIKNIYEL
jgi:hypothetical protein